MNPNQQPQTSSSEGRSADDDSALSDFLSSLTDYTPTIPDELVEHYLAKSGFQCPDVRLTRLVAVATQKFVAEVAGDALRHCKARQSSIPKDKRDRQQKAPSFDNGRSIKGTARVWCEFKASRIFCRQPFYWNGPCHSR
ncbi:transcription initiation factor TFIID subunit 10-like isoform X2 [Trifolium pratense]|uniref:Uncharacterized protein n=1 Tax=Trifolium pratense TaxID=57577 RepID=A0ACB0IPJ5_TRIPR|nr:transcription initiation factor TFIID subunit 10-like isoform X2 [Trifolium pratense]CAJ2634120.1 unnamed protein product [Trifolium pratense]